MSVAVIVAVGVTNDGQREVLGMDIGPSEAETFWTAFLRKLARRGLRGVKLVVADAPEGIKATVAKVLSASWLRCRVHFMRNALEHAGKSVRLHRHCLCPGRRRRRTSAVAKGRRPAKAVETRYDYVQGTACAASQPDVARQVAAYSRRWWRNSGMLLNAVLTLRWSDRLGLLRLS